LANLRLKKGDADGAERLAGQAMTIDPVGAAQKAVMADVRFNQNRFGEAELLIREALKTAPESPTYLDSLGWALYKQGKFEDAAKALKQAVVAQPPPVSTSQGDSPGRAVTTPEGGRATVWDHLGDVYWRLSQKADAAKAWETAARLLAARQAEGREAKDADLERVQKKVQSVQAGQTPDVAPLAAKQ
jgi:tetratricopeptide (TPR) repeat protein